MIFIAIAVRGTIYAYVNKCFVLDEVRILIRSRRGQNAVEYLSIIGIAMLMLIPATMLFLSYSKSTNTQVISSQFNLIGNTIINKAEEMYVIGKGSWVTLEVTFPEALKGAEINGGQDLVFNYTGVNGESQAVFFVDRFRMSNGPAPTTCNSICSLPFTPGLNKIRIEYDGIAVQIRRI